MFSTTYKDFALRLAPSIFLSHIFTSFGQDKGFWEIINTDGYFAALMIGLLCCMLVSYVVTETTARLNTSHPWESKMLYRSLLQTLFGLMMPFGIVLILITIYFATADIWILDSYWPAHCAPYVIIALLFANGAEMFKSTRTQVPILVTTEIVGVEEEPAREKLFKGQLGSDIIFMWSVNRTNNLLFTDGSTMGYHCTMTATLEKLARKDYMYLNRQQVVKISAIYKARYIGAKRKQIQLFLNVPGHPDIIVSEKITRANREFWKKYLAVDY
jgi:hypothetical protein